MLPITEYRHIRGQPFTISEQEQKDRLVWPNCVSFYIQLKNGLYHLSHGPSGRTVADMKRNVAERIESYAGTELPWAEALGLVHVIYSHADEAFRGEGIRLQDAKTKGAKFYVTMQDKTNA